MTYRIGRKNPLNIYEVTPGDAEDRSVTQCHTPEDAARIVEAVNAQTPPMTSDKLLSDPCSHPASGGRHEVYVSAWGPFCRACGAMNGTGRASNPPANWPRAQKQGWGTSTFTGDPPPIPTYGPGSRFAEAPRQAGEPPSGDTPEAIALDAVYGDQSNEGDADRIAARIRALVVGELRDIADKVMDRANRLPQITSQDDYYREGNHDAARMVYGRARALESGGGK